MKRKRTIIPTQEKTEYIIIDDNNDTENDKTKEKKDQPLEKRFKQESTPNEPLVIEDEMYVYELKCIMHKTSPLMDSYFDSVLLFSFYDLQRPFPFCPFPVNDLIDRKDLQVKGMFVSPVFMFRIDMNENDIITLMNWYKEVLSPEPKRKEYSMVLNAVANQDISGRFLLFPSRNVQTFSKLFDSCQKNANGNYSFVDLYANIKKIISNNQNEHTCTIFSLDICIQEQVKLLQMDMENVKNDMLQNPNYTGNYQDLSQLFEDCVVINKKTDKLCVIEFIDIISDPNCYKASCTEVNYIPNVSTLRHSDKNYLKKFIQSIHENRGILKIEEFDELQIINCNELMCIPFSIGVLKIMERRNFIQEFNERIVMHLKSLQTLEQQLDIYFSNPFLLRQSLMHDSFALYHGNRFIGNERLEFLGDAVLDVATAQYYYHKLPNEVNLLQKISKVVSNQNFAQLGNKINLKSYILSAMELKDKHVADAIEALTGAIFLDQSRLDSVIDFCQKVIFKDVAKRTGAGFSKSFSSSATDRRLLLIQGHLNYTFIDKNLATSALFLTDYASGIHRKRLLSIGRAVTKLIVSLHVYRQPTVSLMIGALSLQRTELLKGITDVDLFPKYWKTCIIGDKANFYILVGLLFIDSGLHFINCTPLDTSENILNSKNECDVGDLFVHRTLKLAIQNSDGTKLVPMSKWSESQPQAVPVPDQKSDSCNSNASRDIIPLTQLRGVLGVQQLLRETRAAVMQDIFLDNYNKIKIQEEDDEEIIIIEEEEK